MALWTGLAGGIAAFLVNFWLTRRTYRQPAKTGGDGWRHIDYGSVYRAAAIGVAGVAMLITLAASGARADQRLPAILLSGFLSGGAIWFLYEVFLHVIRFNAREIQSIHFGRLTRTIAFADVADARFVRSVGMTRIRSLHGTSIWVPPIGGHRLLGRFGRRLERALILDRWLGRGHVGLSPTDTPEVAAVKVAASSRVRPQTVVAQLLPPDEAWICPSGRDGDATGAEPHRLVLLTAGAASLACSRHRWTMRPGDAILVPPRFPFPLVLTNGDPDADAQLAIVTGMRDAGRPQA